MVRGEERGGSTAWSSQGPGMVAAIKDVHDCAFACVVWIMQPTVLAVARSRGTAGPGGGPAGGVPAKGCRNRSDERLVVESVGGGG
ncbi:putative disease resistance protein [Dorcoceras hygrometricum]|uniref:Putative disease resistance protein n=1 Tax=Dorcoceras hygrometricum TaxID=472368 RepID=A0A2Z7BKC0_9LAMI|nr:putative disease resistance protein [Dorcoceras hygrometricum]